MVIYLSFFCLPFFVFLPLIRFPICIIKHNKLRRSRDWDYALYLRNQYLRSFRFFFSRAIRLILKALYCVRQYKHKQQTHYREQDDFSHYLSSFWIHTPTRVLNSISPTYLLGLEFPVSLQY